VHRRFFSPRWLVLHVLALAAVVVFCRLGWWQIGRAGDGNALSYGYALEWPVFAAFTVFVWYRIVRDAVQAPAPHAPTRTSAALPTLPPRPQAPPDDDDPVLTAYNRYLAELNRRDS
jgi:DNA-binding transcriptional regulator of glucitol operon